MTAELLAELFSLAGPVHSVALPPREGAADGSHRGFGFLRFWPSPPGCASPLPYAEALFNRLHLYGKALAVRPLLAGSPDTWQGEVHVSGLHPTVDAQLLRELFTAAGPVTDVRMMDKGPGPPFAFVSFPALRHAARASRVLDALPVFGSTLHVVVSRHARSRVAARAAIRTHMLGSPPAPGAGEQLDSTDDEGGSDADEGGGDTAALPALSMVGPPSPPPSEDDMELDMPPMPAPAPALAAPLTPPRLLGLARAMKRAMRDRVRLEAAWGAVAQNSARCQAEHPSLPPARLRIAGAPHGPLPADVHYAFEQAAPGGGPVRSGVVLGCVNARRAVQCLLAGPPPPPPGERGSGRVGGAKRGREASPSPPPPRDPRLARARGGYD